MTGRPPAVVLCADLAEGGVDLAAVRGSLAARFPGVSVTVVPHLCRRPSAAAAAIRASGGGRAVVGACRRLSAAEVRPAARSASASPYDVAVVRVPRTRGTAAAATTVAAALERLLRQPDHEPARRIATTAGLSRGALLRLSPVVSHQPVAVVDSGECAGFARCGACAAACPADAIVPGDGAARILADDCDACGRCLPACPTGAIHLAGASPAQLAAELATLAGGAALGIVFACTSALAALDDESVLDGWGLVEVPALRIISPGSVAQAVLAGAARVCLCPCDGDCCEQWRAPSAALDLCRRMLGAGEQARVLVSPAPPPAAALETVTVPPPRLRPCLSEPEATVAAVAALDAPSVPEHPASPLGLVDVGAGCTACGACAVACPAGALTLDEDARASVLRFDARRCTGCGLCVTACPEDVVTVVRGVDPTRLAAGPVEIRSVEARRCRGCGDRLPAAHVVERARSLLAAQRPELAGSDPDLCLACACRAPARRFA